MPDPPSREVKRIIYFLTPTQPHLNALKKTVSQSNYFVKKSFHLYYRIPPEQYFLQIIVCDNCNDMRHKRR